MIFILSTQCNSLKKQVINFMQKVVHYIWDIPDKTSAIII